MAVQRVTTLVCLFLPTALASSRRHPTGRSHGRDGHHADRTPDIKHAARLLGVCKQDSQRRLAFVTSMGERGTTMSTFDYAHFSEAILGFRRSLIAYTGSSSDFGGTLKLFQDRFGIQNVPRTSCP